MPNHTVRTVVAVTLDVITQEQGYIPPTKNPTNNTHTKVLAILQKNAVPKLEDPNGWQYADEIIGLFKVLDTLPEYKEIQKRPDAAMYRTCIETAKQDEIEPTRFVYAVAMANLYATLKPRKPKSLNPLTSQAKITQPGEYLGSLNQEDRFFVKLIGVAVEDATRGGHKFVVHDRNGNVGVFYDKADKYANTIFLGDCFAIHATPMRFVPEEENNGKQTVFRRVTVIQDTIKKGREKISASNDVTGRFVRP